jgi:hypothetical protein
MNALDYDQLRRLAKTACLSGSVFFRGNDRSRGDRADAALAGLREECAHLIGAGKKVVLS